MGGGGGIAPLFLTSALDGDDRSASRLGRFTPRRKRPRYPLDRRLGGPPRTALDTVAKKKSLTPVRNRTPGVQLVAIPSELAPQILGET
jgi:hypothetical protein